MVEIKDTPRYIEIFGEHPILDSDIVIKKEYKGLDGGMFGLEEIADAWNLTLKRPDGTIYTRRVLN